MNEIERLKHLLHHWMEHNEEHAETYRSWAEKANSLGKGEVSRVLERLSSETKRLNELIEEARKKIEE